jgi:hypothetical protein
MRASQHEKNGNHEPRGKLPVRASGWLLRFAKGSSAGREHGGVLMEAEKEKRTQSLGPLLDMSPYPVTEGLAKALTAPSPVEALGSPRALCRTSDTRLLHPSSLLSSWSRERRTPRRETPDRSVLAGDCAASQTRSRIGQESHRGRVRPQTTSRHIRVLWPR